MPTELIVLPYVIGGIAHTAPADACIPLPGYRGAPRFAVPRNTALSLSAAIASAQDAQPRLAGLSLNDIQTVLARTVDYYLATPAQLAQVVELTCSSLAFVREGIDLVKAWCRDLAPYLARALPETEAVYRPTAPVVLVLPGSDSQETLFCLAQILLSRNACIVRPSGRGASAYLATEFVNALQQALDELGRDDLRILGQSLSVVHTEVDGYLEPLAMDGWNYVFFGDSKTGQRVTQTLQAHCQPRRIIVYGTGLSMTVVGRSGDLDRHLAAIVDSVTVNAGNECISTDILYVEVSRHDDLVERLNAALAQKHAGDPFDATAVGWVRAENAAFILGELTKKGKRHCARVQGMGEHTLLHPTVVTLSDYDTPVEYPGPVVSVRAFDDLDHLHRLVERDLAHNDIPHNLVSSIFADEKNERDAILPLLQSHVIKLNLPTHHFDCNQPHQGIYLLRKLVRPVYVFDGS